MRFSFNRKLKSLLLQHERRSVWFKVLLTVACLVVCVTSYSLILPALTMNGAYVCGLEAHTHGVACYALNEQGETVLICQRTEHQHDEHCLVVEAEPEKYICGHAYEHMHDEGCYCDGALVCTLTEHTHSDACLNPAQLVEPIAQAEGEAPESITPDEAALLLEGGSEELVLVNEDGEPYLPEDAESPQGDTAETEETVPLRAKRRAAALAADNLGLYNLLGEENPGGLPFPIEEDETWVELESDGATVRYSITNAATGKEVDAGLVHGEGFAFNLAAYREGSGTLLENYQVWGTVYYWKVYSPNFRLFMNRNNVPVALETYAADWVGIGNSAQMRVAYQDDCYWFAFRTVGISTVRQLNLLCALTSNRSATPMALGKSAVWESSAYSYHYSVTATIPHAVNDYSQFYRLQDVSSLSLSTGTYNGFTMNADNGFFEVTLDGTPLLPIDQAYEDPTQRIAYYLDRDSGFLYLLNRTPHTNGHQVTALEELVERYPGWCLCWGENKDRTLVVSYLDTYGQQYYGKNKTETFLNRAELFNQNGSSVQAISTNSNLDGLLRKTYSAEEKSFTISFNANFLDLSERGDETLFDVMTNGILPENAVITVSRRASVEESPTALTEGTDFSIVRQQNGFSITLTDVGAYQYFVTYPVILPPNTDNSLVDNTVEIVGTAISQSISVDYNSSESSADSDGWFYIFNLRKSYEDGNPPLGASFGLFRASDDVMIAKSVVESASDGSDELERHMYFVRGSRQVLSPLPYGNYDRYVPGGDLDVVYFHSAGLELETLYYAKEIEAPEDFNLSDSVFYFYATDPAAPDNVPEEINALMESGASVTVIDNWRRISVDSSILDYADQEAEESCFNNKFFVNLPATGGFGAMVCYTAGSVLALSPLLWLALKIGRKGGFKHHT